MDGSFEKEFDFDMLFENDSISNYLVLRAKDCNSILNYQVQMLLNNDISGLLKFNVNYMGNGLNCFYNVTSKCSLLNFMSRKKFSRNEFLIMVLNIINNICCIKSYLLYDCNILLDERYIFVEPERMELYFVYLPFTGMKNDYKTFFIKLIVDMANFYRENSDNYLQRLLEVIKSDLFNLSIFKAQLESLLKIDIKNQVQTLENYMDGKADPVHRKGMEKTGKKADKKVNEEKDKKSKGAILDRSVKIPLFNEENNISENSGPGIMPEKNTKKNIEDTDKKLNIVFILLQPVLLIVYIIIITRGFIDTGEGKSMTAIIVLVILASVDILVFRLIRERYGNTAKGNVSEAVSFITGKMRAGGFYEKAESGKGSVSKTEKNTFKQENSNTIPDPQSVCSGETEVIRKKIISARAYLKETQGETVIELDKSSILVGRMEGLVDAVINNSAVGKVHAEILSEEGSYYLVDCNSRNGTFVNDKRLAPNTRNKILNNDFVRFANKEYKFFTSVNALEETV